MPKLILHIGDSKAGSTAIQSAFSKQTYTLTGENIPKLHYPKAGQHQGPFHKALCDSLHHSRPPQNRHIAWKAFSSELRKTDADIFVASCERFEFVDPIDVKAMIDQYLSDIIDEVIVVIYVRTHAESFRSRCIQVVREGIAPYNLDEFADRVLSAKPENATELLYMQFAPRIRAWKNVFGNELRIRPMVKGSLLNDNVVEDFMDIVLMGSQTKVESITAANANASLSHDVLCLIEKTRSHLLKEKEQSRDRIVAPLMFVAKLIEHYPIFEKNPVILTRSIMDRLYPVFLKDARACDVEFFKDSPFETALTDFVDKSPEEQNKLVTSIEMENLAIIFAEMIKFFPNVKTNPKRRS